MLYIFNCYFYLRDTYNEVNFYFDMLMILNDVTFVLGSFCANFLILICGLILILILVLRRMLLFGLVMLIGYSTFKYML